jgi:hypothetical protein
LTARRRPRIDIDQLAELVADRVIARLAEVSGDLEVRWSTDATGHLAVYRPPCGTPGCRAPSMAWCRCPACRKILGRCRDHVLDQPLAEVRAEHGAGRCR